MKSKEELVSVVVPIHNAERDLSACIESISAQSYKNIEIILVNDASMDGSLRICNKYLLRDPRIRMMSKSLFGEAATRNLGIELARGKYICFVNSDDIIEKEYVEKMVYNVEDKTMTFCGYRIRSIADIKENSVIKIYRKFRRADVKDTITDVFHKGFFTVIWNKIYDLEILKDNQLKFDENVIFGEDLLFNLEYLKHGVEKFKNVSEPLYQYIWRERGRVRSKTRMDFCKIYDGPFDKMLDLVDKIGVPEKKKSVIYRDYMDGMIASIDKYYKWYLYNNIKLTQLNNVIKDICDEIEKGKIIENTYGIDRLICRGRLYLLKKRKLNIDYYLRDIIRKTMQL